MYKDGDKVEKLSGYAYIGVVRSVFPTGSGAIRLVVEMNINNLPDGGPSGMLHIFSPNQMGVRHDGTSEESISDSRG